jgi:hypothetical protein
MKFNYRYRFPDLLWTSPYRKETPLHYYVIRKCGFELHHLEYIQRKFFVENYPVFRGIFQANNPIPEEIKRFWGDENPSIQNTIFETNVSDLEFDITHKSLDDYILIEWDLVQEPILGSYIYQIEQGFFIPDQTHPLTYFLQPFDLTICLKKPIAIKQNNIKILQPIKKINVKTAIELIFSGIESIASYLPFDIIIQLKNLNIDEIDAWRKINSQMEVLFSPKKEDFKKHFSDFVQSQINKDFNDFYLKIVKKEQNREKILKLIGFEHYDEIFKKRTALQRFRIGNLKRNSLHELKIDLKNFAIDKIINIIKDKKYNQINLNILKEFPDFKKLTLKIMHDLKTQLGTCKIYKIDENRYDISELNKTYYGNRIIVKSTVDRIDNNTEEGYHITSDSLQKIMSNFEFLKLKEPEIVK